MTARQIREELYPNATKAQHGTVQKLLQRLEEKGYVERQRDLSVYLFSAKRGHRSYVCEQLEVLAKKLTGGSFAPLMTYLIEDRKISSEEIDKLRGIADGLEGEEDGGGPTN